MAALLDRGTPNVGGDSIYDATLKLNRRAVRKTAYSIVEDSETTGNYMALDIDGAVQFEGTDLTVVIQAALDAITPTYYLQMVEVHAEDAVIGALTVDQNYTDLKVTGGYKTASGFAGDLITVTGDHCRVHGTGVIDMGDTPGASAFGITFKHTDHSGASGLTILNTKNEGVETHGASNFFFEHMTLKGMGDDGFSILRKSHHGVIAYNHVSECMGTTGGSAMIEIEDGSNHIQIKGNISVNNKTGLTSTNTSGNCIGVISDPNKNRTVTTITELGDGLYEVLSTSSFSETGLGIGMYFTGTSSANFNDIMFYGTNDEPSDYRAGIFAATAGLGDATGGSLETTWGACHNITISNNIVGHTSTAEVVSIANGDAKDARIGGISVQSQATNPADSDAILPCYGITISDNQVEYVTNNGIAVIDVAGSITGNNVDTVSTETGGLGRAYYVSGSVPVTVTDNEVFNAPTGFFFWDTDGHTFRDNRTVNCGNKYSVSGTSVDAGYLGYDDIPQYSHTDTDISVL